MPRIRNIKPAFWSDAKLAELPRDVRFFYIGLWNEADDEGRFQAHPRRVLGAVFPYEQDLTPETIAGWLELLVATGRAVLYEVGGEPFCQLTKLVEHQNINRPTPSKIPPPAPITEDSVSPHPGVSAGSGSGSGSGNETDLPDHDGAREASTGEAKEDQPRDGSGPARQDAPDGVETEEQFIDRAVRAVNEGMHANPRIQGFNEIPPGHGESRQAVHDWLAQGVPREVIILTLHRGAKEYAPSGRFKQVTTLVYFNDRPLKEWRRVQEREHEQRNGSGRGGRGRGGRAERDTGKAAAGDRAKARRGNRVYNDPARG